MNTRRNKYLQFTLLACLVLTPRVWGGAILATNACYETSFDQKCDPHFLNLPALTDLVSSGESNSVSGVSSQSAKSTAQLSSVSGVHLGTEASGQLTPNGGPSQNIFPNAVAQISDTFRVSGVQSGSLQWIYNLHGVLNLTAPEETQGNASTQLLVNGKTIKNLEIVSSGRQLIDIPVTFTIPFVQSAFQDESFAIVSSLICTSLAGGTQTCSGSSEFMNTASLVAFHVLDPNGNIIDNSVTVTTSSGFDYSSVNGAAPSVPEPGTIALMFIGISLLAFGRWVSRRSHLS